MFTTVQGYYNGNQIILDENVPLAYGQRVMVTILEEKPKKKSSDFSKYRAGKYGISMDAQDYGKELREDKAWGEFLDCLNGFSDDFMQNGREEFAFTTRDSL